MSLESRNEESRAEQIDDESVGYQRATYVFPLYTLILIIGLVAVFACQLAVDGVDSILFGGRISTLIAGFEKDFFKEGQYWRILTGAALHLGLIHLAFNSYALYVLG